MVYSNYRIQLVLHLAAILLVTIAATFSVAVGVHLMWMIIPVIILFLLICRMLKLIVYPIRQVRMCLLSMRCNDRMMRMPKVKDRVLQEMYDNLNEILTHYHENECAIETKKMYYDRVLRIMTHEIRNTVTPIITLSDYCTDINASVGQEEIKEGMKIINAQSKSIKRFLDSYHTLTHLPPPVPENISIRELFNEMFRLFEKENENVKLIIHYPDKCIYADPSGIRIVLTNLLRNAIQSASLYDDGCVELRATLCDNSTQISVADNGEGIPRNRIDEIFLPFYSTREQGSGIGLCLSRQIMQLHNGELTVESYPENRHTVFTMKFELQK